MKPANQVGNSPATYVNYYAVVKAGITSVALMALSVVAMKGIERYAKRKIAPLQKNLAGIVLSTVYLVAAARFWGPLTKKIDPPSSSSDNDLKSLKTGVTGKDQLSLQKERSDRLENPVSRVIIPEVGELKKELPVEDRLAVIPVQRQRDSNREHGLMGRQLCVLMSQGVPISLLRNPIDLTRVDPCMIQQALKSFQFAILKNGVRFVDCAFPLEGRVIFIQVDISTYEKQQQAFRLAQQWETFIANGQREALPLISADVLLGRELEDQEDFEMILDLARPDPMMSVMSARYNEEVHGVNGDRMKQRLFTSLLNEYAKLLEETMKVDPKVTLRQLEAINYCWRSREEHLLMWMLHYLVRTGSESSYHITVTGEEARYWDFIGAHQALMEDYQGKETTYNQDVLAWSRALACIRMTPRIQSYQESLVRAHYEDLPAMTAKTFHQAFALRNEELRRADSRMKLWSVWANTAKLQGAISYCDYFGVNPPNLRKVETWTNGFQTREIFYLRHSTPHSGAAITKASIDLTYREFLKYAGSRREGVVYAVHQRLDDFGVKFEQEGYRVQSIVDLEHDHPNLLVLVQSVENDLFKKGKRNFTELKEAIIDSFKQKSGARRNRLPQFLVEDQGEHFAIKHQYETELRNILDSVQQVFFSREVDEVDQGKVDYYGGLTDPAHLTSESQAFIMLFYHFQREHLKFADLTQYGYDFTVKYLNSGCKDDYDRGGGQNSTTDRVHQHLVHGADVPQKDLEATLSSIQAPPVQGKGIPAIKYRLHPALFVSSILANLTPKQLEELQAIRWNGWSLASYDVGHREGQTAV